MNIMVANHQQYQKNKQFSTINPGLQSTRNNVGMSLNENLNTIDAKLNNRIT